MPARTQTQHPATYILTPNRPLGFNGGEIAAGETIQHQTSAVRLIASNHCYTCITTTGDSHARASPSCSDRKASRPARQEDRPEQEFLCPGSHPAPLGRP